MTFNEDFKNDMVTAVLSLTRNTEGTTFSVDYVSPMARLEHGYNSYRRVTTVAFSAPILDVQRMLSTLRINAGYAGTVEMTLSLTAQETTVVYEPWQSRYYKFVPATGIKWTAALAEAATKTFRGVTGHLAAIETDRENEFIAANIKGASNIWIAGTDKDNEGEFKWAAGASEGQTFWKARCAANSAGSADSCTGANSIVAGGSANGVYADGIIDNPITNTFSSWDASTKEPNNWGGLNVAQGGENYVATNWKGTFGLWNDLPDNTPTISGYLVEFPNAPNKAFEGVIRTSVQHRITEERSEFAARNVKVAETEVPGQYRVTWDEPKAFSDFFKKIKAKRVFTGYRVETEDYIYDRCFVRKGQPRSCLIGGFRPKVEPIFSISATYDKTPEFLKKVGQRTFGVGGKGKPSSTPDFINVNLKNFYTITSGSKLVVSATGLKPSSAWSVTNTANGRAVMSGTTNADGEIASRSTALPIPAAANFGDPDPFSQVNLLMTYIKADGTTVELPYSYQTYLSQLMTVWNGPKAATGGIQLTTWPAS